jgi:hypothetical protein
VPRKKSGTPWQVYDAAGALATGAFVKTGSSASAAADQIRPAKSANAGGADFNKPRFFILAPSCRGDDESRHFERRNPLTIIVY